MKDKLAPIVGAIFGIICVLTFSIAAHLISDKAHLRIVITQAFSHNSIPTASTHDAFSECGIMTMILLRHDNAVRDALDTRFTLDLHQHPYPALRAWLLGGEVHFLPPQSYINYAFGSRHLEAIALTFFSYSQARLIYGALSYGTVLALLLLAFRFSLTEALAFCWVPLALLVTFGLDRFGLHLAHAPAFFAGFGGIALLVGAREFFQERWRRFALFGFIAVTVSYFDLMNGGLPVATGLAVVANHLFYVRPAARRNYFSEACVEFATIVGCFVLGFVALTVVRLGALWLLFGIDWKPWLVEASMRFGHQITPTLSVGPLDVVLNLWNWRSQLTYDSQTAATVLFILSSIAWVTSICALPFLRGSDGRKTAIDYMVLIATAGGSLAWFIILPNHAYIHPWLMVRLAVIPAALGFVALTVVAQYFVHRCVTVAISNGIAAA